MKLLQKALCLVPALIATLALSPAASAQVTHLVISQVYGGGGNSGSTYKNDFIELFNPTASTITSTAGGFSVQYNSLTGTSVNQVTALGPFSIPAGGYYLIQEAAGTGGTANLPTPDVTTGAINLSGTGGIVSLVMGTTAQPACSGGTPGTNSAIVDLVGYGPTAKCYETSPAAATTNPTSSYRLNPCVDSNNNTNDFGVENANPHSSQSTAAAPCPAVAAGPAASITTAGYPTPTQAGAAHSFTVTARDTSGNVAGTYTGTVAFTSSDVNAVLPAAYKFTTADAGMHTFSATFNTGGTQSITATDATNNFTSTQSGITVNPSGPAAMLTAAGFPSPTNRAAPHNLTVTAKDASGNIATGYTGTVTFTSTDPNAVLPPAYTFTAADAGIHTFSITLNTTGTQTLTATDTANSSLTASQTGIVVNATLWIVNRDTTVSHLTQGGLVLSTAGTAGSTATLAGIAVDKSGNAYAVSNASSNLTEYNPTTGALAFTSTAGGINLPTSISVDGAGTVWIANTNNSISQLAVNAGTTAPTAISPATGYTGGTLSGLSAPSSIAIDSTGSVWVTNQTNGSFTRFFGAAAPVVNPLVKAITNGTQGTRP